MPKATPPRHSRLRAFADALVHALAALALTACAVEVPTWNTDPQPTTATSRSIP